MASTQRRPMAAMPAGSGCTGSAVSCRQSVMNVRLSTWVIP